MKIIKAFFILLIAWSVILFMLFGPSVVYKVADIPEVNDPTALKSYKGYKIEALESDWLGNWVIVTKGQEELYFKCSDVVFEELNLNEVL